MTEWISVKERLPEKVSLAKEKRYLVLQNNYWSECCYFKHDNMFELVSVTHWAELPEAPHV